MFSSGSELDSSDEHVRDKNFEEPEHHGDDDIGKLMHDFACMKSKDMYYSELADGVKHFKEEEGGRKIMCEAVEKYGDKRVLDERLELIKKLMESMKWTAEEAMTAMQISDQDKSILLKRL